jgi:YbbR domain-containing protein
MRRSAWLWPFRHFGLKVISVAIAVLLWMVVSGEEPVERGLRVPLELQQMPAGLELQSELPALVDVRVRGGSTTLSRVSTGDIVAMMDVHTARPGQRLFQLTPEQVRVPFGVQVLQVSPPSVAMVFEKTATKAVPVVPSVEGVPAPGFVVGRTTSDPGTVDVTGPESAVESAREATTEPVSVAGAREAVNDRVTVGFVDPTLRLKDPKPANVHIDIVPADRPPERGRPRRGERDQ